MKHRDAKSQGDLFGGPPSERKTASEDRSVADRRPVPADIGPLGREGRIRVGTSGYSFADLVGPFYPEGTPRGKMLDEYVHHFDAVEINSSYYRIPSASMFERMN